MSTGVNYYSDYGSGTSSNSSTSWPSQETWSTFQTRPRSLEKPSEPKSASYQDLLTGKCTLDDIMKEFQMNGQDSPYSPDEDRIWSNPAEGLVGMGPASAYLRQKSWPAPERTPVARLPRPRSEWLPSPTAAEFSAQEFTTSTPVEEITLTPTPAAAVNQSSLTEDQLRVLNSLPNAVLFSLLNELEQSRGELQKRTRKTPIECRFCKNNGERESYYRGHALKDGAGRVACPVLRAFVCRRCGARGDHAHTIKYCPLSTADERMKSAAMMRSVRMASGRRRTNSLTPPVPPSEHYMVFGETPPSVVTDNNVYNTYAHTSPLDPLWAALEQKLML